MRAPPAKGRQGPRASERGTGGDAGRSELPMPMGERRPRHTGTGRRPPQTRRTASRPSLILSAFSLRGERRWPAGDHRLQSAGGLRHQRGRRRRHSIPEGWIASGWKIAAPQVSTSDLSPASGGARNWARASPAEAPAEATPAHRTCQPPTMRPVLEDEDCDPHCAPWRGGGR